MNVPETFFTVSQELKLFGLSALCGAAAGPFYDIFRIFRRLVPHNAILTALEDILFCTGFAFLMEFFASAAALGQLRAYHLIGSLLGFVLYLVTAGRWIMAVTDKLKGFFSRVLKIVFAPVTAVFALLRKKAGGKFVSYSKVIVNNIKKIGLLLQRPSDLVYNKKENTKRKNVKRVVKKTKIT